MREVGLFEAKNKLSALLDEVENGEEVIITRRGRRVARLVPDTTGKDRDLARQAAAAIIAGRKGVLLGGLKIRDLINEGRH